MDAQQYLPGERVKVRRFWAIGIAAALVLVTLVGLVGLALAAPGSATTLNSPSVVQPEVNRVQAWEICCGDFEPGSPLYPPPQWISTTHVNGIGWNYVISGTGWGKAHGGTRAMWFGDPATGEFGGQGCDSCTIYSGELVSTYPVTITDGDTKGYMTFWSWEKTEMSLPDLDCSGEPVCDFDSRQVWISTDQSNWEKLWDTRENPTVENQWHQVMLDISPYIGQVVYVKFVFDTVDGRNNDAGGAKPAGWFVDDIGYFTFTPVATVYLPIIRKGN